jgi:hypothetical protein
MQTFDPNVRLVGKRVDPPSLSKPFVGWTFVAIAIAFVAASWLSFNQGWLSLNHTGMTRADVEHVLAQRSVAEQDAFEKDTRRCQETSANGKWPSDYQLGASLKYVCDVAALYRTRAYPPWQPTAEQKALVDDAKRCEETTMEGNWPIAVLPEVTLGQACARRAAFRTDADAIALNTDCVKTNAFGKWPRPGLDRSLTPALICDALELKMGVDELAQIAIGYHLLHP